MKRLFTAALALLIAATAFGQSYPSPTYNNLTVQGTGTLANATVSGAATFNGTFTATGKVGLANLATQAANTLVGNATGSSASPTAITVTGCNGAAQALQWTNASGFGCNSSIATSGANANITSLSGLTTALSVGQGGTGRQTLTTHGVLLGEGTAAINQTAVGTTGQMLLGVTGADPAFGNNPTITGGTIDGVVIGGTTPAAGSFTNLSSSGTVSGTGFSNYLASPPAIGGTAANSGKFTTLQATSTITPSSTAGIVGTTTNDNANAGSVGEFVSNSSSGVSLTSGTPSNITSISLTAGDWDVSGAAQLIGSGVTSAGFMGAGISTTSATFGSVGSLNVLQFTMSSPTANHLPTPIFRVSIASTTTVFLVGQAAWSGGTFTANGFIRARRVR